MSDGITPMAEAFLAAIRLREATEGLTGADVDALDMSTYAKIRERAGLPTADPYAEVYESNSAPPGRPRQDPGQQAVAPAQEPDFRGMTMAEYEAARSRYIRPAAGSGVGIFGNDN